MNREWAASPGSNKLYRGTSYSLALGIGTMGTRLEKAGVAGMISSRNKLRGFGNPFAAAPGAGGGGRGGGGRGGAAAPGSMTARGGGGSAASVTSGRGSAGATAGAGGWGTIEMFETYNTIAPAVALTALRQSARILSKSRPPRAPRRMWLLFRQCSCGDRAGSPKPAI